MDARSRDRHLDGARRSHAALLAGLEALRSRPDAEAVVRADSLLPGWTVGHVLTHLARNADSHARMIEAACRGEVADQYPATPGGTQAATRQREIDAGAGRAMTELVDDVRASALALELAWAACTPSGWAGHGRTSRGDLVAVTDLPFRRWREVEVHRVDLGPDVPGATVPSGWPAAYVREELGRMQMLWAARVPMGLAGLPDAVRRLDDAPRLAWLLGRLVVPGVAPAGLMT